MKSLRLMVIVTPFIIAPLWHTQGIHAPGNLVIEKKIVMKSISPNIFVNDLRETMSFYEKLGFSQEVIVPDSIDPYFVIMKNGQVSFMFQSFKSLGDELPNIKRQDGGSLLLYINMTNIKEYFETIKNKVQIYKGLEETFYGALEFSILDNNNYILTFSEIQD